MAGTHQVPEHLRQFVVTQNYSAYTAEDQAVWRFVLSQTHARLLQSAHPAYASGFAAAGISTEEIPHIARMNEQLARSSFEAVCVDGFIPPRAFQGFQARGFLPIAADIRTSSHLTYTPAPDIIHEAAGHAPFLAHRDYARYLREIGDIGEKAFANRHDQAVYQAIFLLSELKEDPSATPVQISRAELRLNELSQHEFEASENARLARLYWWTVEYGLVGSLADYRLYGAGLLSSIGEGHFCRDPGVAKLPLTAACLDVSYDITKPQPQLFVARDFDHLSEVLESATRGFACRVGGEHALHMALQSGEPATLELAGGLQVVGEVVSLERSREGVVAIELSGGCAVAMIDQVVPELPRVTRYVLPLGALSDGTPLSEVTSSTLRKLCDARGQLRARLHSGIEVSGHVQRVTERAGRIQVVVFSDCTLRRSGQTLLETTEPYPWVLSERVITAHARPPQGYQAATTFASTEVPKLRSWNPAQRELIGLYDDALSALRHSFGAEVVSRFETIHRALRERFPDEWLLRWNLLESLVKLGQGAELGLQLVAELESLEIRYAHREPIATGLSYLRALGGLPALASSGASP